MLISNLNNFICLQKGRLMKIFLIIVLSLTSNLLFVGKIIAYMTQVLSLSWLMKKIWKGFNQKDVTKVPSRKVELWLCNGVQELAKTVITQCIDDLWKATLRKIRKSKPSKKLVGVEQMRNLMGAEQVMEVEWHKHSWCQVIVSVEG